MDNNNEQLFKSVFNNIVLFRYIYESVRLYKKNECVIFKDLKSLREYKEREYVQKLVYKGCENLEIGDLPIGFVLKEVNIENLEVSLSIQGEEIPYGVEILEHSSEFDGNDNCITTSLSSLPPTIHTIKNVVVIRPDDDARLWVTEEDKIKNENNFINFKIPPNITSISFYWCYNFNISPSSDNTDYIEIPNTLKYLQFSSNWDNYEVELSKDDIPDGLTSLDLGMSKIFNLKKGILPNSIKELTISFYDENYTTDDHDDGLIFSFIPPYVESLQINYFGNGSVIPPISNFKSSTSIRKLFVYFNNTVYFQILIKPNSMPSSILDLTLLNLSGDLELNAIPNSVTILDLAFNIDLECNIKKEAIPNSVVSLKCNRVIDELPSLLRNLEFYKDDYSNIDLIKIPSILPKSLTSITLPIQFKQLDITLPSSINNIKYV